MTLSLLSFLGPVRLAASLLALLFWGIGPVHAQTWRWAVAGRGHFSALTDVVTDPSGDVFVGGVVYDSLRFGATVLHTTGFPQTFVARLSPTGQVRWTAQVNGLSGDWGCLLARDTVGDVYMATSFRNAASFGPITLFNAAIGNNTVVAKLSGATGQWQWASAPARTKANHPTGLAIDHYGNLSVAGFYSDSIGFGGTRLTNPAQFPGNYQNLFVAGLNGAGQWQFAWGGAGRYQMDCSGLAVDDLGNAYLGGSLKGSLDLSVDTLATGSIFQGVVLKVSALAGWQWGKVISGPIENLCSDVVSTSSGNIAVAGFYIGSASFGNITLSTGLPPRSRVYVAEMDATGQFLWAIDNGSPANMRSDLAFSLVAGPHQSLILTGTGVANFGPHQLVNTPGTSDICVAALDSTHQWAWATQSFLPMFTASAYSRALAVDAVGQVTVVGDYTNGIRFGTTVLADTGVFVARFGPTPTATPPLVAAGAPPALWPNPAHGTAWVRQPGAPVELLDALGRRVRQWPAPAAGQDLPLPLTAVPAGLYLVRCGARTQRLLVE